MFGLFGRSKQDILDEGRQAMATVRQVADTGTRINGKPKLALTLDVAPMGAPTFTIEKKLTVADDAWPQVGQQIPVRYLPEDQDRCEIDERALEMTRSQIVTAKGTMPAAPPPPPPPPTPTAPPVPDPPQAPEPDISGLPAAIQEAMAQGNVTWSGNTQIVDARNVPGLRAQMIETLKQYGIQMSNRAHAGRAHAGRGRVVVGGGPGREAREALGAAQAGRPHRRGVPGRQGQGAGRALTRVAHDEDGPAAVVQDRLRRAAQQACLQPRVPA